ncbi:SPFH domain-containing protein [Candidatus Uhrbacteria bacterium]|nr:SPFH domain-containing protein [Candidatus Uhrbacteria bacterium]
MNTILILAIILFLFFYFLEFIFRFFGFLFGAYAIVKEREARVYILFGDIVGVLDTPGFHFLWGKFGLRALLVNWLGRSYTRDLALDQEYIRSIPVNSEEGTPMGIGVWYEMFITDPVAHIFRNADPRGSLSAQVRNAAIKRLSSLPMNEMLTNRHAMSRTVRAEVSPESNEWGYKLGSVYIRKVHFRDTSMIHQIEEKVVNRLRQVTSAIKQDGVNQVSIIKNKAEREAAVEFAKATMIRPQIVGSALQEIAKDSEVLQNLFRILEYQRIMENTASDLVLLPEGTKGDLLAQLIASAPDTGAHTQEKAKTVFFTKEIKTPGEKKKTG